MDMTERIYKLLGVVPDEDFLFPVPSTNGPTPNEWKRFALREKTRLPDGTPGFLFQVTGPRADKGNFLDGEMTQLVLRHPDRMICPFHEKASVEARTMKDILGINEDILFRVSSGVKKSNIYVLHDDRLYVLANEMASISSSRSPYAAEVVYMALYPELIELIGPYKEPEDVPTPERKPEVKEKTSNICKLLGIKPLIPFTFAVEQGIVNSKPAYGLYTFTLKWWPDGTYFFADESGAAVSSVLTHEILLHPERIIRKEGKRLSDILGVEEGVKFTIRSTTQQFVIRDNYLYELVGSNEETIAHQTTLTRLVENPKAIRPVPKKEWAQADKKVFADLARMGVSSVTIEVDGKKKTINISETGEPED